MDWREKLIADVTTVAVVVAALAAVLSPFA